MLKCPASVRAVSPSRFLSFTLAPAFKSSRTISTKADDRLWQAAHIRAVQPFWSFRLTFAPARSSNRTVWRPSHSAAQISGAFPSLSASFTCAWARRSDFGTQGFEFRTACESTVILRLFLAFTSAPAAIIASTAPTFVLHSAIHMSAVLPLRSRSSKVSPLSWRSVGTRSWHWRS